MRLPPALRSIRARLAVLILLAMTALATLLVYQQIDERNEEREQGERNLQRIATFAAHAERERFETAERLLVLAVQSSPLFATVAADPRGADNFDRCTRSLFVLDQLLPETSGFALWDPSGDVLCSSEAAEIGEFSVDEELWFRNATERQEFATGGFELSPPDDEPSLGFGIPVKDSGGETVAYLSTGLSLAETEDLLRGTDLPDSARLTIVDRNGTIINSTFGDSGQTIPAFEGEQASLTGFLSSTIVDAPNDRTRAAVRITDAGDTPVTVVVSADNDALAAPLSETLVRDLLPLAIVTVLTLGAVWLLAQRWIASPVSSLVRASDAITGGRLGARAKVPPGVTEFERLGASFNEMAATREQASHAKDEFLGLVSHELKTPITTVLGNAEILRSRGDRLDPELRQGALDDIHESAQRLVAIIDNLLTLARLERGAELETEPLALTRMAEVSMDEQLRRAPGRRVVIHGNNDLFALGGETYVEQVMRNLVANALKYSPADEPVEIFIEQEGDMAVVRVCDRGQGIDASEREAVFEPFYRSARTAGFAEGIGIGLSVCKRLVEAMGGEIWSAPRQGGGSEFGFTLPVVSEDGELSSDAPALTAAAT